MTPAVVLRPLASPEMARRVFGGEVLVFPGLAKPVARLARQLARKAFAPLPPARAHRELSRDEFLQRAAEAQRAFENHPAAPALFAAAIAAAGVPRRGMFLDLPRLRIAPPVALHSGGAMSHIGPHRDTWGVGIQAQMNWWAAAWPLARNRTLAFYPEHFRRPLENTTAEWSFAKYNAARRSAPPGRAPDYPSAPVPKRAPDSPPVPAVPAPGDLLCFASAQLHASVPNATRLTRLSVEVRSVNRADLQSGRAAPNADCETPRAAYGLFRSPESGERLVFP